MKCSQCAEKIRCNTTKEKCMFKPEPEEDENVKKHDEDNAIKNKFW